VSFDYFGTYPNATSHGSEPSFRNE
jgi:hypothetical protein